MAKVTGRRRDRDGGGFGTDGLVAVAIDKDKNSQNALKWAVDNLLLRGQTIVLVHVKLRASSSSTNSNSSKMSQINGDSSLVCGEPVGSDKQLYLPFRCLCSRKDIQCKDVLLEESDVARALVEYAKQVIIEVLVVGSSSKGGFLRFNKAPDIPGTITKNAPDFCSVYVINKGKLSTKKMASRAAPSVSPLLVQLQQHSLKTHPPLPSATTNTRGERQSFEFQNRRSVDSQNHRSVESQNRRSVDSQNRRSVDSQNRRSLEDQSDIFRSPFGRTGLNGKSYGDLSVPDFDISFISSGRPSTERNSLSLYDNSDPNRTPPRLSNLSEIDYGSFESMNYGRMSLDINSPTAFSTGSFENDRFSSATQGMDDVEAEMRRLKLELKQTMDMYSTACKEALTAKQKATKLERWKLEEERKMEVAKLAEEAAEKEKAKSKAAMEESNQSAEVINSPGPTQTESQTSSPKS